MRSGGEAPCDGNTLLEATIPEESVIVISDDEGDVSLGLGNSVLLIEDAGEDSLLQEKKTLEVLDEELAITFSRKAHVMPHARYDCSTHPFLRFEEETQVPIEKNASFCDECYCYLCDKPASECSEWVSPGNCHCNAHNKSKYWKEQRDTALVGVLTIFNLDLTEIDTELKDGGNQLQLFLSALSPVYSKYLEGTMLKCDSVQRCGCFCHKEKVAAYNCNACALNHVPVKLHNYSEVHKTVTDNLNQVNEERPKAAAVMLLGTARELVFHKALANLVTLNDPLANIKASSANLMSRIVTTLQRLLVLNDYPKTLYDKFVSFFQSLPLPPHLYSFTSSLNVIRWDNWLLTSVLAGQNLTGTRTNKGKKECLWEPMPVVQSRVKKLEDEKSYRQLVRYLNAVRCPEYTSLKILKQKLCFYTCKYGDFFLAANTLMVTKRIEGNYCKFFTPQLFEFHLLMLRTRSCPPGNELVMSDVWVPIKSSPLRKGTLVRTALKILFCNDHLFHEPKCWSALVRTWCTSEMLSHEGKLQPQCVYDPDLVFKQMVMTMSCTILDELQRQYNVILPDRFHKAYCGSAEMILIVQAVIRFMMATNPPLRGMLELITAFGPNHWALSLLLEWISPMPEMLFQFISSAKKDLLEDEQSVLQLFERRGISYVSQLLPVFLLHPNEGVRSVGFHFLDVISKNSTDLPWSGNLSNCLQVKVLRLTHTLVKFSPVEHQKLTACIGRLTSRS
ncbi:uncharacterized protein LOC121008281 [Bufo bufo]|uniref:uncharacterized protein LOC121008281 n=1 Tax=Bufo bufo TaxID=8384 RepID=UPI001ABE17AA|nr:uncharacterized protein LOC121008281 [Bufo bufo]